MAQMNNSILHTAEILLLCNTAETIFSVNLVIYVDNNG